MLHLLAMDREKPRRSAQERALLTGGRAIAEQGGSAERRGAAAMGHSLGVHSSSYR